jgi:hypothetical protein
MEAEWVKARPRRKIIWARNGHRIAATRDAVEAQREFPVFYRNEPIGHLTPDLIVDDKIIVESIPENENSWLRWLKRMQKREK